MYNPYQQNFNQQNFSQMQSGGFVSVRNEMEARSYPVAYGNSVTFKDETAPYIYVKTMGFSQLDTPVFDKYRLVKEQSVTPDNVHSIDETYKSAYEDLKAQIDAIKRDIEVMKNEQSTVDVSAIQK